MFTCGDDVGAVLKKKISFTMKILRAHHFVTSPKNQLVWKPALVHIDPPFITPEYLILGIIGTHFVTINNTTAVFRSRFNTVGKGAYRNMKYLS